jgi:hypothetical protein
MVKRLEYPIKGGKDTTNIRAQSISQPAVMSLHFFAAGRKAWNIFSLNTRNNIDKTNMARPPTVNRTFLKGDSSS